jgi:hypothetical protein
VSSYVTYRDEKLILLSRVLMVLPYRGERWTFECEGWWQAERGETETAAETETEIGIEKSRESRRSRGADRLVPQKHDVNGTSRASSACREVWAKRNRQQRCHTQTDRQHTELFLSH